MKNLRKKTSALQPRKSGTICSRTNPRERATMTDIHCKVKGCAEVLKTQDPVSANASYICKHHPKAVQLEAAGRAYDPILDEVDKTVKFQSHQFDRSLRNGNRPSGTEHLSYASNRLSIESEINEGPENFEDQVITKAINRLTKE